MNNYNENNIKQVEQPVVKTVPENVAVKPLEKKETIETNNNILNIIIGVIVAVGILFALFYLGKGIINKQNKIVVKSDNKEYGGETTSDGNTCYDLKDYFIVTRDEINDPGENILVKYNKNNTKEFNCEYTVEEGDFELKKTRTENSNTINFAQYYSNIKDNFLIVDEGTGSSRTVRIFDIEKHKEVFNDSYHGELNLEGNILTYWRVTKDIPNKENCSKVDEYKKNGVGAQIETKVSLNLIDLTKTQFKEFKCLQAE